MRIKSIVAVIAATPMILAAAEPMRIPPSSPWVVDYADDSCRLIRTFGEGKTETKLILESSAPGEMDMLAIGKPLRTYLTAVPARFVPVGGKTFDGRVVESATNHDPAILWSSTIRMLPDGAYESYQEEFGYPPKYDPAVRPPPLNLSKRDAYGMQRNQFAAGITGLEVQIRPGRSVILDTGSLGKAIEIFDKCGQDSMHDWGVDTDIEDKIVRPVWALNRGKWLSAADYPPAMIDQGKESEVTVRLLIDASGAVTKCTSLSHFAEVEFNRITCEGIQKHARFAPAELADGTKVPSFTTTRVNYRIAQ